MDMDEPVDNMMAQMFLQAQAQFGSAIKSFWFYDGDPCPGSSTVNRVNEKT
jgi:hypothetical protein